MKVRVIWLLSILLVTSCATEQTPVLAPAAVTPVTAPTVEDACRTAVATTANRDVRDTSVIDSQSSRAGTAVTIKLKKAERPWSCVAGPDGAVTAVTYMGEG